MWSALRRGRDSCTRLSWLFLQMMDALILGFFFEQGTSPWLLNGGVFQGRDGSA